MIFGSDDRKVNILEEYPTLCQVLEVSQEEGNCDCEVSYNSFIIKSRRSKKYRTIDAPCPHLKSIQRALLDRLLASVPPHDAAAAFVRGKSIAMNAQRHHGASHLFTTDIRSFFPSVKDSHVREMLRIHFPHFSQVFCEEIISLVTNGGQLPQGAPSSPHIANLVMSKFDERCQEASDNLKTVYTRYADDISISSNDAASLRRMERVVRIGLDALDMEIHSEKTRHLGPQQTKLVTGLDIGGSRIRPTRAFRRKTSALVRMSVKYPGKMNRHRDTIRGYLAFWYDIDPIDPQLPSLLNQMALHRWEVRLRAAQETNQRLLPIQPNPLQGRTQTNGYTKVRSNIVSLFKKLRD
ncbi:reverse transcriptase domain-containing protein [Falsihalocynthiibacter arcticus]|uniref:RNA-directed DNA polymerase n=1 Tax=Falsihalocynthiibacter arcticus TaxID=1579316 RepID=A0A126V3D5_9RHOB|nr:reverse transcriptase domain-containing protein [Falsihalocynthiibacter arcticus]AML52832.1 hypothetical protein RC74_17605 [Falsihalocynthiibacter arcticus]